MMAIQRRLIIYWRELLLNSNMLRDTSPSKQSKEKKTEQKSVFTLVVFPAVILSLVPYIFIFMTAEPSLFNGEYVIAFIGYFWFSVAAFILSFIAVIIRRKLSKRYQTLSIIAIILSSLSIILVLRYFI